MLHSFRILKLFHWFNSYGNFTSLGSFCLAVELHWGGSASNGATPFSHLPMTFNITCCCMVPNVKTLSRDNEFRNGFEKNKLNRSEKRRYLV